MGAALLALPCFVSLAVLFFAGPEALRPTIPANSDLTGHFLPVELLRTQLLPQGRLHGWSHDWFAGFPLYYFYFPLPSVVAALLGWLMEPALALRLVTLAGPLALPWALYAFGAWSGIGRAATAGLVLVGSLFLWMTSFYILGGNMASTFAGEFSYSWSLTLSVLYLGMVSRPTPCSRRRLLAGMVLAGAVLSHVLPAGIAGAASAWGLRDRALRAVILWSWCVAAGLSAFWTVPLVLRIGFTGNPGWSYVPSRADVFPAELLLLIPAAILGCWLLKANRAFVLLALGGILALATVTIPQEIIGRGRLIPVWALAVHALAGAGVGAALATRRRSVTGVAVVFGVLPVLLLAISRDLGPSGVRGLSTNVFEGIDAKEGAAEFDGLLALLAEQPPGRVHWEDTYWSSRWGGRHALSLIPLFTEHSTVWGLLRESAPILPAVREADEMLASDPGRPVYPTSRQRASYDPPKGVALLRELGVRYFVSTTAETAEHLGALPGLRTLGSFGDLRLFDLGPAPLVLLASGEAAPVHGLTVEPHRIQFRTDVVGVSHVIRTSFFPNWRLLDGEGPDPGAGFFMVVVPRSETVTLEFRATWVEWLGSLVTWVSVVAVAGIALRGRRVTPERIGTAAAGGASHA